ncbi:MAG: RNA 2',3'-cyclic phosphodiesterase [Candidatus Nanoarchaeia archaeon]|nr:RNA 2',3'-cyclic phosphodiesterase [Candidatus Nanoarchaeia archaeon]
MRAFISIDIPDNIKKEIIKIQNKLPELNGKKTEVENLHLTLKFLGWIDEAKLEEVKKILKEIKFHKFETEINKMGMFSDRIIWLNMTNCNGLQREIDEKLSDLFEKEERFMGHLTIARVKSLEDRKKFIEKLREIKIKPIKFEVDNFKLKSSQLKRTGPVYEDLGIYNLK